MKTVKMNFLKAGTITTDYYFVKNAFIDSFILRCFFNKLVASSLEIFNSSINIWVALLFNLLRPGIFPKSEAQFNQYYISTTGAGFEMLNPLSNELDVMRQTLIFSTLESIAYNQNRQNSDLKLFEFGLRLVLFNNNDIYY
jgi:hypothetical protein